MDGGVRIRLCGPVSVDREGRTLTGTELGSRKARTLLGLLSVERGRLVPAERIAESLWPANAPRDPLANVATLVSRLRAVLGDGVITGRRSAYGLLAGPAWTCDLDRAGELIDEAALRSGRAEHALALAAANAAVEELGTAAVLADEPDAEWAQPARAEAATLRRRARHLGSAAALTAGDPASGARLAQLAVDEDPYDERAHRDLVRSMVADGATAAALGVLAGLTTLLRRELGADPDEETAALRMAVLRGTELPGPRRSGPTGSPRAARSPLVGRELDLATLNTCWSEAVAGDARLAVVSGEAGIGKSRLLDEVVALAERTGGTVLAARCHAAERSLFLQPVIDAVRPALLGSSAADLARLAGTRVDALAGLLPELRELLGGQPADRDVRAPERERRRVYEAVTEVLTRLSLQTPVLMVVDDLQEAGVATIELLDFLGRRLGRARVLVLGAVRSEGHAELTARLTGSVRLELGPLPPSAVAAIVEAAGQAEHATRIQARTGGHPLSVVEMLRALSAGERGVPRSLAQAVLARVTRAGATAARTLEAASVLGVGVDPVALAGLLDLPEVATVLRCEELVGARLLVRAGPRYEFVNDLVQEVVYAALPDPLRLAYHRRAADVLADLPEAMARHAALTGDHGRAARGWLLAGEEAQRGLATRDACGLFDLACDSARAAGEPDLRARTHLARARARETLAEYSEALQDIELALGLARTAGDRRLEMAVLRARGGDVAVALNQQVTEWGGYLTAGLELAAALGDRGAEAGFSARLTVLAASRLRFVEALDSGRRALAAARASGDDAAVAIGLDGLKTVFAYLGDAARLRPVIDELEPMVRRLRDGFLLEWCVFESSFLAAAAGAWTSAIARIDEAVELAANRGRPAYLGFFLAHRGWLRRLAGDLDGAVADGGRALAQTSGYDHPWWYATAAGMLACSLLAAGRPGEAAEVARAGAARIRPGSAEGYVLWTAAPLAATGDRDALVTADRLVAAIEVPAGSAWVAGADVYLSVATAWLAIGEPDRAAIRIAPLLAATDAGRWATLHDQAVALASRCAQISSAR